MSKSLIEEAATKYADENNVSKLNIEWQALYKGYIKGALSLPEPVKKLEELDDEIKRMAQQIVSDNEIYTNEDVKDCVVTGIQLALRNFLTPPLDQQSDGIMLQFAEYAVKRIDGYRDDKYKIHSGEIVLMEELLSEFKNSKGKPSPVKEDDYDITKQE